MTRFFDLKVYHFYDDILKFSPFVLSDLRTILNLANQRKRELHSRYTDFCRTISAAMYARRIVYLHREDERSNPCYLVAFVCSSKIYLSFFKVTVDSFFDKKILRRVFNIVDDVNEDYTRRVDDPVDVKLVYDFYYYLLHNRVSLNKSYLDSFGPFLSFVKYD